MEVNDLIVIGTDGLFDNLSKEQINDMLNEKYILKEINC
jgi:serine/threonine protein phosphatase PrpC